MQKLEWVGLLPNCVTDSQYNGKLYYDTASFGSALWPGKKVTIQLDCIVTGAARMTGLCHDTAFCIVTRSWNGGLVDFVAIQGVVL